MLIFRGLAAGFLFPCELGDMKDVVIDIGIVLRTLIMICAGGHFERKRNVGKAVRIENHARHLDPEIIPMDP